MGNVFSYMTKTSSTEWIVVFVPPPFPSQAFRDRQFNASTGSQEN